MDYLMTYRRSLMDFLLLRLSLELEVCMEGGV
jgi:hypothetical protein